MAVVATAGHVDHGKSALVLALTGTDPDRLPEERRRGMTIELGHAWVDLGDTRIALVDVPGHDRLVATTIAGIGPAAGVLLVVAADEGWSAQTEEHVAAVRALGVSRVAVVVTKCDLADGAAVLADAVARLEARGITPLATAVASARTGAGLPSVRSALLALVAAAPAADPRAPVSLWVDRCFSIVGSGTVVTGTLPAGTVRVGDVLCVGVDRVTVRGLQVHGAAVEVATGPTRLAVNLRGVPTAAVPRASRLTTPGSVRLATVLDVALHPLVPRLPARVVLHLGTATAAVRVRPLGEGHARLTLLGSAGLPSVVGDRLLLRDPGAHEVLAGGEVVAIDPAPLSRRGDAARRALELRAQELRSSQPRGAAGSLDHAAQLDGSAAGRTAGVDRSRGGPAAGALGALDAWFAEHPLGAAPAELLTDPALSPAVLADAERAGRVLRTGGAVLAGDVLDRALPVLTGLSDGFGPGDAARALGTSRRAAVAILERLDAQGRTVRAPDGTRRLRHP